MDENGDGSQLSACWVIVLDNPRCGQVCEDHQGRTLILLAETNCVQQVPDVFS
jgi:hypothetical protein